MSYPTDITLVGLDEYGEDNFVALMNLLFQEDSHANIDWFDPNVSWSLIHRYNEIDWTIALTGTDVVAFSGIQTYDVGHRILSRTYYMPEYRKTAIDFNMVYTPEEITPAMKMARAQIDKLKANGGSLAFISMMYPDRREALRLFMDKLNHNYSEEWVMPEGMFLTTPKDTEPFTAWQNICYTELQPNAFSPWDNITEDEWTTRYGTSRKTAPTT